MDSLPFTTWSPRTLQPVTREILRGQLLRDARLAMPQSSFMSAAEMRLRLAFVRELRETAADLDRLA